MKKKANQAKQKKEAKENEIPYFQWPEEMQKEMLKQAERELRLFKRGILY